MVQILAHHEGLARAHGGGQHLELHAAVELRGAARDLGAVEAGRTAAPGRAHGRGVGA